MEKSEFKIVQSYWSKPGLEHSSWSNKGFHFLSWILSCLKLKEQYRFVELVTDTIGKTILIDILKLPYDNVSLELNNLQYSNKNVWTLGKLLSYSIQDKPFIHVDGDVFIWEKLPFKGESLIAQHKEFKFEHNQRFISLLLSKGYVFPSDVQVDDRNLSISEVNAGILGGTNLSFFKSYSQTAFDFLENNAEKISLLSASNEITAINTVMEQFFFYQIAEQKGISIKYLFEDNDVKDDYVKLVDFMSIPHKSKYIHPVGYLKRNPWIGEYIARILYYEYPLYFKIFEDNKDIIYELYR